MKTRTNFQNVETVGGTHEIPSSLSPWSKQQRSLNSTSLDFIAPCDDTVSAYCNETNNLLVKSIACITAPTLTAYVVWVLQDAVKNHRSSLYFLARDGLPMYTIASALCDAWNLPIKCKYLYCSRYALRIPLYAIDKRYAVEKMCQCMFDTRLTTVLMRAGIPQKYFDILSTEFCIAPSMRLNSTALKDLSELLLSSKTFDKLATESAQDALAKTISYLKQEIDETEPYAIVDSGWSGSIQQCFTMLKKHIYGNDVAPMTGYYFGLFRRISEAYGQYNCFLFHGKYSAAKYSWFNNILFECMCAADHGMTIGYENTNEHWRPILAELERPETKTAWSVEKQLNLYARYAKNFVAYNPSMPNDLKRKDLTRIAAGLLRPLMGRPTFEEATLWGSIPFTDDTNATGYTPIARALSIKDIRMKSLTYSLLRIITKGRGSTQLDRSIYWRNGSLALSQSTTLQRIDMLALEWLYRLFLEG
jgi:hypothetical protein